MVDADKIDGTIHIRLSTEGERMVVILEKMLETFRPDDCDW